jgi:hypothetical protein
MLPLGFPSLTPLSSFNSWALSLAAFRTGEMEAAALDQEFARLVAEMNQISLVFRSELRYQDRQPPMDVLLEQALDQLERCEDGMYLLHEAAGQGSWDQISQAQVERLGTSIGVLFERFTQIREIEGQRPQLAASPYVHELLRCMHNYAAGKLTRELVEERLASVSHHFLLLKSQLESTPLRLPAVEQLLDILDVQQSAFEQLAAALQAGSSLPQEFLQVLIHCSEEARLIHQEILDLQGSPAAWCGACEGIVGVHEGCCSECGQAISLAQEESGVMGLVELVRLACQQDQPADWALLTSRVSQSLAQLKEVADKARNLPQRQPRVETALSGLQQVLREILDCSEQRDGATLWTHVASLEEALSVAQEAQTEASKELQS